MTENNHLQENGPGKRIIWVVPPSRTATLHVNAFNEPASELARLGWDVTLLTQKNSDQIVSRGFAIRSLPMPRVYLLGQFLYHSFVLGDLIKHWRTTDVIYFHQESAFWISVLRLLRVFIPGSFPLLIMDIRTVSMIVDTPKAKLRALYNRWMIRLAHHWTDGETAITQRLADAVGIPPSRLLGIWPSAANRELFSQAIGLRHWPAPGEPIPVIYVGSLYKERNVMAFCRAVVAACERGMDFTLTVIGSGDELEDLQAFAAVSGGRVRVLPPVMHSEVPRILSGACIGVLPFPDEEKFRVSSPIKLFEYLAAGMPIIATRIVCHTDVVSGEYVFWADGSDESALVRALESCWTARNRLEALGQSAFEASVNWTWAASAKKISDALISGLEQFSRG